MISKKKAVKKCFTFREFFFEKDFREFNLETFQVKSEVFSPLEEGSPQERTVGSGGRQ
jgi:hypothetical protein